MRDRPFTVAATSLLVPINAFVWLAFGLMVAAGAHPALPDQPLIKWVMALLALATSGIFLGLFILLGKRGRLAYFLSLASFFVISLLTIFDQVGLADLIVLTLNVVPAILLIKDRAWYLQARPPQPQGSD